VFCINKFRGFRPCGRGQKIYSLPPASCPLPLFGDENITIPFPITSSLVKIEKNLNAIS
jgi:hypothetical protein